MGSMVPNPNRIALKEWAIVSQALSQGQQVILLRKGGIDEEGGVFRLRHKGFFIFPTLEHQDFDYIRPEFVPHLQSSIAKNLSSDKEIAFSCLATVTRVEVVSEPVKLHRLSDYHIWNDAYIRMRYQYKPTIPLHLLLVRAYRMQQVRVENRPSYKGCKSWVELESAVEIRNIETVLTDKEFQRKCLEIQALLA